MVSMSWLSSYILPVVAVDDTQIGDGRPGEVTLVLLKAYRERVSA